MAEVIWLRRSLANLRDIDDFITQFDPQAASSMSDRLRKAGDSLDQFPNRGRPTRGGVRVLATVPPFQIHYEVEGDIVYILTVRHGRRRPVTP